MASGPLWLRPGTVGGRAMQGMAWLEAAGGVRALGDAGAIRSGRGQALFGGVMASPDADEGMVQSMQAADVGRGGVETNL